MTTLTVYAGSSDGYIYGQEAMYADARDSSKASDDSGDLIVGQREDGAGTYEVYRVFLPFDTSAIPDNAIVTAATLYLTAKTAPAVDFTIKVHRATWTSPLSGSQEFNYDLVLSATDEGAFRDTSSGWVADTEYSMALDPGGINVSGDSRYALLSMDDETATPPGASDDARAVAYASEAGGTSKDPRLVIEYTVPTLGNYPLTEGDTRIVLLNPARQAVAIITDQLHYKASPRIFDQSVFEITVPHTSQVWTKEYSGATAASVLWMGWSFDYYFRGVKKFSGPVASGSIEESGALARDGRPVAFATLQCCSWLVWFLGGRTVQTGDGGHYDVTNEPWDDMMREIVRLNATTAFITPPGYPAEDRDDFGPFTLTVEADTSTAVDGSFKLQTGKSLLDNVAELASHPEDLETDGLWPYVIETSTTGTFEFKVLVGRGGGSRGIGADKTATVYVSPFLGTVRNAKLDFNHAHLVTTASATGKGRAVNRARTWVNNPALVDLIGVREEEVNLPASTVGDAFEREAEAQRLLAEANEDTTRTYIFQVSETSNMRYGVDYSEKDSITAVFGSTGEALEKMVIGADIEQTSPGTATVALVFGRYPANPTRDAQRSGGGGRGGGRRNGGKPRDGDGQSETDPDDIVGYGHFLTQSGDTDAEGVSHYAKFQGKITATAVRAKVTGTNDGASDSPSNPDLIEIAIEGDYTAGVQVDDGYVVFKLANGNYVRLLAKSTGASP